MTSLQGEEKFDISKIKPECNSFGSWKHDCSFYCLNATRAAHFMRNFDDKSNICKIITVKEIKFS